MPERNIVPIAKSSRFWLGFTPIYNTLFSFNFTSERKNLCGVFAPINNNPFFMSLFNVFALRKYFKVFDPIVKFVSIHVINNFKRKWFKFSADRLFHNISMLKHSFSINGYSKISVRANISRSLLSHVFNYNTSGTLKLI